MKKFKKYLGLLIVVFGLIPVFNVKALDSLELIADDKVTSEENVNGSSVLAGNTVEGKNTVNGIGILFGNNVNFDGTADYSLIAGNLLNVNGTIKNDGLILGNVINVNENFNVGRDLFIFGNEVELNGTYSRNVTVFASKVTLTGDVAGDLIINAENIEISGDIGGTLKHNKDAKISITTNRTFDIELTDEIFAHATFADKIVSKLITFVSLLVTYLAFVLIVPNLFKKIDNKTKDITWFKGLSLAGYGALSLIIIPIIAILLISFVFGISIGFILINFYILAICLANMFSGYLLGSVIWNNFIKKDKNPLLVGLLGITLVYLLSLIPFISTISTILSLLIGIGLVFSLFKRD